MTVPTDPMDRAKERIAIDYPVEVVAKPKAQRSTRGGYNADQPRDEKGRWAETGEWIHESEADLSTIGGNMHFGLVESGDVETTLSFDDGTTHDFTMTPEGARQWLEIVDHAVSIHANRDFPLGKSPFLNWPDETEYEGIKDLALRIDPEGDINLYFSEGGVPIQYDMTIDDLRAIQAALQESEDEADAQGLRSHKPRGVRRAVVKVTEPAPLDVVRDIYRTAELRTAGELPPDVLGVVSGHFTVFDTWYRISSWWEGDFVERVAPGAGRKTMSERGQQIVSAFDHGMDPQIGDKVLGPFRKLNEDRTGGYYEIDLLDTSYNRDLMPGLKRGLYSASFRFQVVKDEWVNEPEASDYNPDRLPERTIKEYRLFELGPVTYPANPAATAAMRSGTDSYYERLARREPARVGALRSNISKLRTTPARPARVAAPRKTSIEPRKAHSGLSARERREALYPYLKGVSA